MRSRIVLSLAVVLLIATALGCISGNVTGSSDDKKDALAKCLTEKGVKMYGAYWCPHCNNQKNEFGDSFQYIDYIECDPKGANPNPKACTGAGIRGYPTWIIDGIQYSGEQSLGNLAKISGCSY